ncbi:undecaprenyl-diphosphate phosphatase [Tenuibacillus multivorans]|uniref:Undecaprenyl-diphosphatase n=1 Tax=Tenuibacillus multivorans TaxID=237069 RepID=A0A1G9ZYK4_9BACI|nr:undecaprenyl-diphosphate phosphatase [Tenuibacillus multivorans]GEL76895.1 undecaprenyl-diphosphatase 1 [Tenuibacillus multivorans]SDN26195.1 undecaprenyl-diphosphatase [Tenuibacillus multivorans]
MQEIIEVLKFLFLGIFQGFTEPIPISSSGHLLLARNLLDIDMSGLSFEGFLNFGSLIAVLIVYRKDLMELTVNGSKFLFQRDTNYRSDFNYIMLLVIATIPAGLLGVLFEDTIESVIGNQIKIVGITLILTGIALWIIRNLKGFKSDDEITIKDAIIVGVAQAIALIPGISRSGATIVGAMLIGFKRSSALKFSFLMYIPVSVGTMIFSVNDMIGNENFSGQFVLLIIGLVGAIVASYFALLWFINVMKAGNLKYFAFYCLIVGALVFLFF